MRILAIADEESPYLWDYFEKEKLDGIDLIISAGDLDPSYLSFLVTLSTVPVLYVHGNHDKKYAERPPEGCICIEDKIYVHEGVRILGLGGSMRYHPGPHQYTEKEMTGRVLRMLPKLIWHRGFDILVTHAPAYELNDGKDLPHQGFRIFKKLMDWCKPKYFVHGHVHLNYNWDGKRFDVYGDTKVVNAYERCVFEIEI
jgi:Icc-related predicted phosphoesterase